MSNIEAKTNRIKIAPSLLAADWGRLKEEIESVQEAGADLLHLDVMDGTFVPEITFGAKFVETVAKLSSLPLDVHLMIAHPENHVQRFIDAGADGVSFHYEASKHSHRLAQRISELGAKAGIALNPGTPTDSISSLLSVIDLVLIMTVNPGWGGQSFLPETVKKVQRANELVKSSGRDIIIQVDGGIDVSSAPAAVKAGARCLVAGTAIFSKGDREKAINSLGQNGS